MYTINTATNEQVRMTALRQLDILDTAPEPEFDELTRIAAAICGTPISMISLVDEHRQWFKAAVGLDLTETRREVAFCDYTIRQAGMMLVEDATQDPRFAENPMVAGTAGWRFYAGVPIASPDGQPVGTICVMDRVPRTLTDDQRSAMRVLAAQVNTRLELRVQRRELVKALAEAEAAKTLLMASERRFQIFMDSVPFLSFMKDAEGRFVYYNQPMAQRFEVSREYLLNKTDAEVWPADLAASYRQNDLAVLRSGDLHVLDEETQNPDGSTSIWRSHKFPCPDGEGGVLLGAVCVEVTAELRREAELKRSQQELEAANLRLSELACIDALTGIANRRRFDSSLKANFRHARRAGTSLALLLLDVDDFKQHNDRFGHSHGDNVLRLLSDCLQSHLRAEDLLARYGGEEFAILLPETTEEDALALASRLLCALSEVPWPHRVVTVSMGISALSAATPDTQRLLTLADEALYAAKRAGKNRAIGYGRVYREALAAACDGRTGASIDQIE